MSDQTSKTRGHIGSNLSKTATHQIHLASFPNGTTANFVTKVPTPEKEIITIHLPTTQDTMALIAVIDVCGRAFIGQHDRDEKWVFENHEKPFSKILNENGGVDLTIEDIDRAYMEHSPVGISMHFIDQETQNFYHAQ